MQAMEQFENGSQIVNKIVIENLSKSFRSRHGRTAALDNVDITVGDGEFFCIVGPSGCGKSTLIRIIADLEIQTRGLVRINQQDRKRPLTAMVFQDHGLFPWMTVLENAAFGLEMAGIPKAERKKRVLPYLDMVRLTSFIHYYPHQLSGGMRQRVSLVRAFVMDPEVLLMDEPFAALDAQNKILLQDELVRIWERDRKTVIYITHSLEEAIVLGDRIAVMTSAPGRLKEIIRIDFPRPRNIFEIRATPTFASTSDRIWKILESEVRNAAGIEG